MKSKKMIKCPQCDGNGSVGDELVYRVGKSLGIKEDWTCPWCNGNTTISPKWVDWFRKREKAIDKIWDELDETLGPQIEELEKKLNALEIDKAEEEYIRIEEWGKNNPEPEKK